MPVHRLLSLLLLALLLPAALHQSEPRPWHLWENNIVCYKYSKDVREADRKVIEQQMDKIEENVGCLKFRPSDDRVPAPKCLRIEVGLESSPEGECRFGGVVSPGNLTLRSVYRVSGAAACRQHVARGLLHELLHVLGAIHTHRYVLAILTYIKLIIVCIFFAYKAYFSHQIRLLKLLTFYSRVFLQKKCDVLTCVWARRPDRDKYITVHEKCIQPGARDQFLKCHNCRWAGTG